METRRRLIATLTATASVALAGGALAVSASGSAGAAPTRAAASKAVARSDATSLLASLALPVGATRSATEPAGDAGVLARPAQRYATPNEVDDHAWWLVPGDPATVLAYLDAHRAPKSVRTVTGSGTGRNGVAFEFEGFDWPPILHVLSDRSLIVEVVRLPDGSTGLRADAQVVWITPRPAWERIPSDARRLQVSVSRSGQALQPPFTVSSANRVHRSVALLNALPIAQPGASACPADPGIVVRLAFYTADGTTPLAVADVDPNGCEPVQMTIGGRQGPPLTGAAFPGSGSSPTRSLIQRLDSALGVALKASAPLGR